MVRDIPHLKVYATKYTKFELMEDGVNEANIVLIKPHKKLNFGAVSIFPIAVSHSTLKSSREDTAKHLLHVFFVNLHLAFVIHFQVNYKATYAATTLKTLFPAIDGHRLVVVSNSYKELFENRLNHLSIQKERMLFLLKFYSIRIRL